MEIRYLKDEDGSVSQAVSCDEDDLQSKTKKKNTLCPQYRNKTLKAKPNAPNNVVPSPTSLVSDILTVLLI